MLTANEIVKEQMLQTTSKKVLRSSEKRNRVRARSVHTLHRNWRFHWLQLANRLRIKHIKHYNLDNL